MTNSLIGEWPARVPIPELPEGYEWVCLRQVLSIREDSANLPWYIRLRWTIKGGKKRMLRMTGRVFESPQQAISYAVREANLHYKKRHGK